MADTLTDTLIELVSYLYPNPPHGILVLGGDNPPIPDTRTREAVTAIAEAQQINRANNYDLSGLCEFHIGIIYAHWGDFSDARQQFVLARRQWKFAQQKTAVSESPSAKESALEPNFIKAVCLTHFAEGYAQEAAFAYGKAISTYRNAEQCLQKTEQCLPEDSPPPQKVRQCDFLGKLSNELEKRMECAHKLSFATLTTHTPAQQRQILQKLTELQKQQKIQHQEHLQQLTQLNHQQEMQHRQHWQQRGLLQQQQEAQEQRHMQQMGLLQQQQETLLQQMGQLQEQLEQLQQSRSRATEEPDNESPQLIPVPEIHLPFSPTAEYRNNEHRQWYSIHTPTKNVLFPNINANTYVLIDTTGINTYKKGEWLLVKNRQRSNDVIVLAPYPPIRNSRDRNLSDHSKHIQLCHLGRVTQSGKFKRDIFSGKVQFSKELEKENIQYHSIIGIVIGIWYERQIQNQDTTT